jgi:plasmid stability protein
MAQILVRDIPDDVKEKLRRNAETHGRSLEAEVRDILTRVEPAESSAPIEKSGKALADLLLKNARENPIPDDVWDEFQASLKHIRKTSRARRVNLGR